MDYLKAVQQSLQISLGNSNIYQGKDGALRLAREIGSALNDCDFKIAKEYFEKSYNEVCVIGYNLKPPVDKKEWDYEVQKSGKDCKVYISLEK